MCTSPPLIILDWRAIIIITVVVLAAAAAAAVVVVVVSYKFPVYHVCFIQCIIRIKWILRNQNTY
jgi:hypothetical protein